MCVVIGDADDPEAVAKAQSLREAGADVRRFTDTASVGEADVAGAFFVISTPQDAVLSQRLRDFADRHRFLLCCIDQPAFGFVAMTAVAKAGPVRVAISTTGMAPRVGKMLKDGLQRAMDARFARFVERLAKERERVRAEHPLPEESETRRVAAIDAAHGFRADVAFVYPPWFDDAER